MYFASWFIRSGGSLEVAVSHDDDLSQGKISSHVRAKVKIVLMMIFLNGKDHHMKLLQIGLHS